MLNSVVYSYVDRRGRRRSEENWTKVEGVADNGEEKRKVDTGLDVKARIKDHW